MEVGIKKYGEGLVHNSIKDFVTCFSDSQNYDRGDVEAIKASSRKNTEAIGTLLNILCDKKIINADELSKIVGA